MIKSEDKLKCLTEQLSEINTKYDLMKTKLEFNLKIKEDELNECKSNCKLYADKLRWSDIQLEDCLKERNIFKQKLNDVKLDIEFIAKFKSINPFIRSIVTNEITNKDRNKNGYRFADEIKAFALFIYLNSPKTYKLLKSIFILPSKKIILSQVDSNFMETGLSNSMIKFLQECNLEGNDKICTILLDEVHVRPFLNYNSSTGSIDGKTDLGDNIECSKTVAKSALVFMLCSFNKQIKVPICYYFTSSSVSGKILKILLMDIINKLFQIDIKVHNLICDQGPSNQKLANELGINLNNVYFKLPNTDHIIYFHFDTPHLFKCLRNNLLKYQLNFIDQNNNKQFAHWKFIEKAFKLDQENDVSFFPKVTCSSIYPSNFEKMNVSHCMKIFSNTFSCGMKTMVNDDNYELNSDANGTIILIKFLNDLFDILNNKSCYENKYLKQNSEAHQKLKISLKVLDSFEFVKPSTFRGKIVCVDNLKLTIVSLIEYQKFLNSFYSIDYILTGQMNQDNLENFFSALRFDAHEGGQLRCCTLRKTFYVLLYSGFFKREISKRKNCIDDNGIFFCPVLKSKTYSKIDQSNFSINENEYDNLNFDIDNYKLADINVTTYIAGFCLKKLKAKICAECFDNLQTNDINQRGLNFTVLKQNEKSNLIKCSTDFVNLVKNGIEFFFSNIDNVMYERNCKDLVCKGFLTESYINLGCFSCSNTIKELTINILFLILINHHLKKTNLNFSKKYERTKDFLKNKK